jgi:hypothetical protein
MKIMFVDANAGKTLLVWDTTGMSHLPPIPRKGEVVYLPGQAKRLVKYVRWSYAWGDLGTSCCLETVEIIVD